METIATQTEQRPQKRKQRSKRSGGLTTPSGLRFERVHSEPGVDPFDTVEWEVREALITAGDGEVVFHQKDCEVPAGWSQLATNVVASKYFRGHLGTPERESSVRQLIGRVVDTLRSWGLDGGYFDREEDADIFRDELCHYLLQQKLAFNSPVWFNMGVDEHPQCSACFINGVTDDMESIMALAATEARLFKGGSGTGSNLSSLRSSRERLSGGGIASGPVSFMKGFDAFAGVIRSGGKTRRAAKMVILNIDHPDIEEYINCKADEEKKAWALIDAGYDGSFNGEAYSSVFFQNSNNSVRVTDEFMRAVEADGEWHTHAILDGQVMDTYQARDLFRQIAEATWVCGDPGMQFDTTINRWHTCPADGRIDASNPCSEYMFLSNSACNLASMNLLRFRRQDGTFDTDQFEHCVSLSITAQEIIVDASRYPTEAITRNSHRYRPLGLGYANLGALLMAQGLAYDSDEGRAYAATVTSLMHGAAFRTSARIAQQMGPFEAYQDNRESMLHVIGNHRDALDEVDTAVVEDELVAAAERAWEQALEYGELWGYRNAQATVLAPTGTIGFLMDCDTTGIEPDLALVKYKKLVGGGMMKIVNNTVPLALRTLGYDDDEVAAIVQHIDETDTIEGAPHLRDEHLPVFDCAFKPLHGSRSIAPLGHVKMMGAVQPFLSGAISKTVNVPHDASPEDIEEIYLESWRNGLKAVAVYRDGCKRTQPLDLGDSEETAGAAEPEPAPTPVPELSAPPEPMRRRLEDERAAITHKFSIAGHEGYLTVGQYEDGSPGEIFIVMAKQGSTLGGVMDAFATSISIALQYGVPLETLCNKFAHTRFEPQGFTTNRDIPIAKSIMDYIFRWLALKYLPRDRRTPTPDELIAEAEGEGETAPAGSLDTIETEAVLLRKSSQQAAATTPSNGDGHGKSNGSNGNGRGAGPNGSNGQGVAGLQHAADALYVKPASEPNRTWVDQADAPPCPVCGTLTTRSGSCYKCLNCGATTGCS